METSDHSSPQSPTPAAPRTEAAEGCRAEPLGRLSQSDATWLLTPAARLDLAPRQALSYGELPMENVYLIETGLVSVMAKAGRNRWVEAWMVGPGGFVGLPAMLTDGRAAYRRVVQVGGTAVCIPVEGFRRLLHSSRQLRALALEHFASRLLQASQTGVCNAQHSAVERIARWLLLASDELHESRIAVSHEMLARAIGLRRATVSDCLKQLDARGALTTHRRLIEITDGNALQSCSCDCYRIMSRGRQRYAHATSFL